MANVKNPRSLLKLLQNISFNGLLVQKIPDFALIKAIYFRKNPMKNDKTLTPNFPRQALETLGKKLSTFTHKKHDFQSFAQSQTYQSIDLTQFIPQSDNSFTANKNAFHEHIPKLSKRLFGSTKFGQFGTLAGKVVPPETLEKFSDKSFLQIGKLAQAWAEKDLKNDKRFNGKSLNINERHALAQAIAHQNRALVALGSMSNLAGLVGILGDTVWLLMVALRSIFQIAHVYDKPLTGKAGIQIAYEILAKANLDKLQEKQTLLAGIGVVEAVIDKNSLNKSNLEKKSEIAETYDLKENPFKLFADFKTNLKNGEYKKLTKFADEQQSEQNSMLEKVMGYVKHAEQLARKMNLNLQAINLGKLNKVLPITAVGIGASYNNVIIDEVLNIAMATFAPQPKLMNEKQLSIVR